MDNLLKPIIEEPEREFHVRELAKLLGISPMTISRQIKVWKKNGIILQRKLSNHILIKANTDSRKFKECKIQYNFQLLRNSGLIEFLEDQLNNPAAIVLFGSFAKGEDTLHSDIDLFVSTPLKKQLDTQKFEEFLNHKIQLFLYSREETQKMQKNNKELLNNIINGITISGFWEVFS